MIKIIKENPLCQCGHYKSDHGSYGTCYKVKHSKERKKNPRTGKYMTMKSIWCCNCKEFKEVSNE